MTTKKTAPQFLEEGAETYRARNKTYGDSYNKFGRVMDDLFPEGLTIESSEEWARLGVLVQLVGKITRYANDWENNPHQDSLHDIMVYSAMLQELEQK